MKDIEEEAKALKVAQPSAELDRRIDHLLTESGKSPRRTPLVFLNIPLWGCAVACAIALFTGVLYGRSTAPVDTRPAGSIAVHYILNSGGHATGNLFDWTDQRDHFLESASGEDIHVAISQTPKSG